MAASVVESHFLSPATKSSEDLPGVVPSSMDCRGRPLATEALTTTLLRKLSLGTLRAAVSRLRQPAWEEVQ